LTERVTCQGSGAPGLGGLVALYYPIPTTTTPSRYPTQNFWQVFGENSREKKK